MVPRSEFPDDVSAGIGRQSQPGCGGTASRGEHSLDEGAGSRMARQTACRGTLLPGPGIARHDGALERVSKAGHHAVLCRAVVIQIFMQARRDAVLHGPANRVGRKPSTKAFAEPGTPPPYLEGFPRSCPIPAPAPPRARTRRSPRRSVSSECGKDVFRGGRFGGPAGCQQNCERDRTACPRCCVLQFDGPDRRAYRNCTRRDVLGFTIAAPAGS